ncbi:MAG: Crp/Fnr family transcriptional regulator [Streptosporangiaceae bacterium]|jgi:CRP/FNR family transcriptional regulator, cyclic AMP receptor protein
MSGQQQIPGHPTAVNPGPNSRIPVAASALAGHQFLRGMPEAHLGLLAGAASLVDVPAGHRFFAAGRMPHQFWLIRAGRVALDMEVPGRRITVETLGRGEMVGLSWFLPPCQWQFGAIAIQPTEAFEFDAATVLRCCDEDPAFGYELTRRVLAAVSHRLQATRAKLLEASAQLA